jgi:dienelactone hydrolase
MSCPDCFRGSERIDATPTGKAVTLHNLPTYVAEPSEGRISKGIVVIISDAFGWEFVNNRLMVDEYARSGDFTVFLPDFMNGMYFLVASKEALACLTIRSIIIHILKHIEAWPCKSDFI